MSHEEALLQLRWANRRLRQAIVAWAVGFILLLAGIFMVSFEITLGSLLFIIICTLALQDAETYLDPVRAYEP